MSTTKRSVPYKHDNDCQMTGCPGHTMQVTYQSTSDYISIENDWNGGTLGLDLNELTALLIGLNELKHRAEIEGAFERAEVVK